MYNYENQKQLYINEVEKALEACCHEYFHLHSSVARAAAYSLLNGGKRVRGVLTLAVCDMLCKSFDKALPLACAVEMIHSYSLIHDDLPCMDNDDMRRGKPSCHKMFGEATALLAGDALLTAAFKAAAKNEQTAGAAVNILAEMAGARGMIYGQELDLQYENQTIDETRLCEIHKNKTGCLINAAVLFGAVAAKADEDQKKALSDYAYCLGLTFQIIDDILDITADESVLGKPVGSDDENNKCTFVSLRGLEESKKAAEKLMQKTVSAIKGFDNSEFLISFAEDLLKRNK